MQISYDDFEKLSSVISDRDVCNARLEAELEAKDLLIKAAEEKVRRLETKCGELMQMATTLDIENAYLKNYLWLSWSKIRQFMMGLHDFGKVAFLQTFMQKTLSDKMGVEALAAINDAVPMPEEHDEVQVTVGTANDVIVDGGVKNVTNYNE